MKAYQISDVEKKPEMPDFEISEMKERGLITGSYVFGGWKKAKGSDIDILLLRDNEYMKSIDKYLVAASGSISDGTTYRAYYAHNNGVYFNLIVAEREKEFNAWKKAHEFLLHLKIQSSDFAELLKIKKFRVQQFQLLRETFGWKEYFEDKKIDEIEF